MLIIKAYVPSILQIGHWQTEQTQIRCRLIRVYTVCLVLTGVSIQNEKKNEEVYKTPPDLEMDMSNG